jgi:hypothetical protein
VIEHIGMLTLRADAPPDARARIREGLEALPGVVPGLLGADVREDLGLKEGNAALLFRMSFESEDAWRAYGSHPAHVAVIREAIAPVLESKAFVQVEAAG